MWEAISALGQKLIDRSAPLMFILGFALFILGLAGGISYNQWLLLPDSIGRFGAILGGLVLMGLALFQFLKTPTPLLAASDYGVKITSPRSGDVVDTVHMTGTMKKKPPEGYKLIIFRIHPDTVNRLFVPLREVEYGEDGKTWYARSCEVGGSSGENRALGVYLVGKSGQALFKYFFAAANIHNETKKRLEELTEKKDKYLPLMEDKTEDMIKCQEVDVVRK